MKEKKPKRKNSPFGCPPFYDMEADCFPVSENAENKPEGGTDLMRKKEKAGSDGR